MQSLKSTKAATNSTYPKGGVYFRTSSRSCSKDSFVVKIPSFANLQNVSKNKNSNDKIL